MDRSNAAGLLARGLARFVAAHGLVSLPDFTLRCGRRADLFCLDAKCRITIVEIKSSIEDFRCDQQWPDYPHYCDLPYFPVPQSFPQPLLPPPQGLMVSHGHAVTVMPESAALALTGPARRPL